MWWSQETVEWRWLKTIGHDDILWQRLMSSYELLQVDHPDDDDDDRFDELKK